MTSRRIAVGTIISKDFLSFARVLAGSLRQHHPEIPFYVLLTDEPDGCFDPALEPFRVVPLRTLPIPDSRQMCFRYTRTQLAVCTKPHLLRYLLDDGFGRALFLDADVLVTGLLDSLLEATADHAVVLTPHLLEDLATQDRVQRELNILQSGTYNGGVIGVSDRPSARLFLTWWEDRLRRHCRHDVSHGMHNDQRWLDLVPSLFDEVCVLRDAGCNVAYWNLPERAKERCRFFHFSGFEPESPDIVTRYSQRLDMSAIGPAAALFTRYVDLLRREGLHTTRRWPYTYDCFDNGVAIPDLARLAYLNMDEAVDVFGDPFRAEGSDSYFQWLNGPSTALGAGPLKDSPESEKAVTRLWASVYQSRPDLQQAFPDLFGADHAAFLNWTLTSGLREHGISEALAPLHAPLRFGEWT